MMTVTPKFEHKKIPFWYEEGRVWLYGHPPVRYNEFGLNRLFYIYGYHPGTIYDIGWYQLYGKFDARLCELWPSQEEQWNSSPELQAKYPKSYPFPNLEYNKKIAIEEYLQSQKEQI